MLDREIRFTLRSLLNWTWWPAVSVPLVMLLVGAIVYACWTTSSVASWVQAIGSVAAIFSAIWISNEKDRRDEARIRFSQAIWCQAVTCQVESTLNYLDTLIGIESGLGVFTDVQYVDWAIFNKLHSEVLADLEKIDLIKANAPATVDLVSKLKTHMRNASHFSGLLKNGVNSKHLHVQALQHRLGQAMEAAQELKASIGNQPA